MKIGSFSDLYSRINNLFDRKIDGVKVLPLSKVFPDQKKESTFNLNYNHKTSAGQKFKFSLTSRKDVSSIGKSAFKTTGKLAAEPIFSDAELGVEANLAIAKKDDRDTVEFVGKYKKIDNLTISASLKVDKFQSIGAKFAYDTDAYSGSLDITHARDWYLFANYQKQSPAEMKNQTDFALEGLVAVDADKKWSLGGAANVQLKDSSTTFQNFTLGASYKALDFQATGFARVDWEKAKEVAAGLNVFWEVEKDVQFAAEAVLKPRASSTEDLFDYTVGASFPFSSGTLSGRFGLDGLLGASYTQSLNSKAKFSIGASFDTLDLSSSAYSLTLTLDA